MPRIRAAYTIGLALAALLLLIGPPASRAQENQAARLSGLLEKAAAYCQRLENAALDFVCLEDVTETSRNLSPHTDVYLYDYQFVRKGGAARERRNLLALNGKKADDKDAPLHTAFFQYKNVLFGPIGLLGRIWRPFFVYRWAGEETILGEKAVIVEVKPGPDLAQPHPYGRVWIAEGDGSVLKIVWDQASLGNFKTVDEWAKENGAEPQINSFSEYGIAKNGLRFPSRSFTDQGYRRKDGGSFSSATITVMYREYRFFTVETETVY